MAQTTEQMLAQVRRLEMPTRPEDVTFQRYSGYEVIYGVKPFAAKKRKKAKRNG